MTARKLNQTFTNNSTPPLPPGWDDFCTEKNGGSSFTTLQFVCLIDRNNSGRWNFGELRNYIKSREMKYRFDVECLNGANISLISPAKAKNLIEIRVDKCVIEDYYSDCINHVIIPFPDEMEYIALTDVVIMADIFEMMYLGGIIANITHDCHCGNDESVVTRILSNRTYNFGDSAKRYNDMVGREKKMYNISDEPVLRGAQKMHYDTFKIQHICNYSKMQTLDYSINTTPGKFYINTKKETSRYPVLQTLNFSFTDMSSVSELFDDIDKYFPKLKLMDLSHCNIQKLDIDIDSLTKQPTGKVLVVNFTHNNITELQVDVLEKLIQEEGMFVNFSHNPLNCVCSQDMKELIVFVQEKEKWTKPEYQRYEYIREMTCLYPARLNGTALKDLQESQLMCSFHRKLTRSILIEAVIPLTVISVLLLVIIVVMVRFRQEIRILLYTRFNVVLPCQQDETIEDKKFDAFVSYSNEDHEWVRSVFEDDSIEKLKCFKFCLHHRDFMAGKTITENIIDSIESSRHTIVIVSRHFLDSSYCLYEFEEALRQSLSEKKRHLLVILFEDIAEEEMPKVLKTCLKTFTYIHRDDAIFLDRLVYSLSYKQKRRKDGGKKHFVAYENPLCEQTDKNMENIFQNNMLQADNSTHLQRPVKP
ncbi:toll-like receptor 4 [Saccostrea echinata]|uniref:toll-like receptor 4 n=1 Tax=Saccostrea echinata TaxID=191078 RepID=UPI002A82B10D|nr:toll-like receptor 4 [Saccostrea echinata]